MDEAPTLFPPRESFDRWLESLVPDKAVAYHQWGCGDCPLAQWLMKTEALHNPYIRPDPDGPGKSFWRDQHGNFGALPGWANQFGLAVDKAYRGAGSVSAAQCLKILRKIKPQENG